MCNCSRGGKSDLRGQIKAERLSLLLSLHSVDPTLLLGIPVRFSLSCYLLDYAHVAHIHTGTRVKSLSLRVPFRLGENVEALLLCFFPVGVTQVVSCVSSIRPETPAPLVDVKRPS